MEARSCIQSIILSSFLGGKCIILFVGSQCIMTYLSYLIQYCHIPAVPTEDPGEYPAAADVRAGAGDLGSGPGDQRGPAAAGPGRARVLVILSD